MPALQIIGLTIASIGIVIGTACIVVNTWRKAFDDGPWERMSREDYGDSTRLPGGFQGGASRHNSSERSK